MLLYSVKMLNQSGRNNDQSGINMALDNFVAHGRNLLEFFYYPKSNSYDYARATHFVDEANWEKVRPQKTELIKELERRASNEMVHLSFKRISGTPPEKTWNCGRCSTDLLVVTKKFLEILPEKYFSDTITNLKTLLASNLPESSR
jgi:hypothetical protein